jgi:hypothetical protein
MRKLLIAFFGVFCFSTVLFFGCAKINEFDTPTNSDFAAEAKAWFVNSFANTAEYKISSTSGEIKVPKWNYGKVYKIGNTEVAEFPLSANKKKVFVTEKLTEADARRVVDATVFKVIFVKSPGKSIEIRILEFIPTFEYLKTKNFNINNLSFRDYHKEFKGSFLMFNFNNTLLKGYHFAGANTKVIKFVEPMQLTSAKSSSQNSSTQNIQSNCDNLPNPDPNCTYEVTFTYQITCSGGWTVEEGYNPNYCTIEILEVTCNALICDQPGSGGPMDDCIANGGTPEQCLCDLYGLGCGGGGGTGGNSPDPNQCAELEASLNQLINSGSISNTIVSSVVEESGPIFRKKRYEWVNVNGNSPVPGVTWDVKSWGKATHIKNNSSNPNLPYWKMDNFEVQATSIVGNVVSVNLTSEVLNTEIELGEYFARVRQIIKVTASTTIGGCSITNFKVFDDCVQDFTAN